MTTKHEQAGMTTSCSNNIIPPPAALKEIDTDQLKKLLKPIRSTPDENRRSHFQNWSGEFKANPLAIFQPVDEYQIQLILELCRRESRRLRCYGSGHSPSDLACSDDYMINLDRMSGLIEVRLPSLQLFFFPDFEVGFVSDDLNIFTLLSHCLKLGGSKYQNDRGMGWYPTKRFQSTITPA
jgi:hypothetical protein